LRLLARKYMNPRIKRIVKRIWENSLGIFTRTDRKEISVVSNNSTEGQSEKIFKVGDIVRVLSSEKIMTTLDRWGALKGCAFIPEMEIYCGTTQRVYKTVNRFVDERDLRVKKSKGIILLDGIMCSGTSFYGSCDRSCFFFWREEWLEKIEEPAIN
jgi:hypothetical protein